MKLSVIIVNYNVQYFLENCLNSVYSSSEDIDFEVIIVDNNSVDGSLQMLADKFPQATVVANQENKGFSVANNQGIKIAKGEYILLLNPDTVIEENTFKICCDFFDNHPKAGGIGVKMIDGKGRFLPESKRGLPSPDVAFYKIFGLSALFPRSEKFGQYHLGHLDKDETHEVEILSGAFMMMRKSVLNQIGLLDETFFMYGEDIDLSYRITKAGFTNHYLSDTQIIHYKGESTKKSSINYVFVFYKAMVIFAKKHFSNKNARLFSFLINLAIYLRATTAMITRIFMRALLPILDFSIIYGSVFLFKSYYENNIKYTAGGSYPQEVETFGIPIISTLYLISLFVNGGYQLPPKVKDTFRGLISGLVLILVSYSLLDEKYRFSRAIILFSAFISPLSVFAYRYLLHLLNIIRFRNVKAQRIAIVGNKEELTRINSFLKKTLLEPEKIINIDASNVASDQQFPFSAKLSQLKDIIDIYHINQVIFCAKDLTSKQIIEQMAAISHKKVEFKIAPPKSLYIIGSNHRKGVGEYYIMASDSLLKPENQRSKRVLDVVLSFLFILLSPIVIWVVQHKSNYFNNLFSVLLGKISLVGFYNETKATDKTLKVKKGILNPIDLHNRMTLNSEDIEQINFNYGKDFKLGKDLEIVFKNLAQIGRKDI